MSTLIGVLLLTGGFIMGAAVKPLYIRYLLWQLETELASAPVPTVGNWPRTERTVRLLTLPVTSGGEYTIPAQYELIGVVPDHCAPEGRMITLVLEGHPAELLKEPAT